MNPIIELIDARCSTRAYAATPITVEERRAVLHAAMRAPTGGNMMPYTILEIEDQELKDRLAVTCDDQPFIAKAPWVLVFVADMRKWTDLFQAGGPPAADGTTPRRRLGLGDLLMAASDAVIAAQNAVIAAESLGIGSCYVGDILERGEAHAELLGLPAGTMPVAMLCLGRPAGRPKATPRYEPHVVQRDRYRLLDSAELRETLDGMGALHAPHGLPAGVRDFGQYVYARKFDQDFMVEMNRSCDWWLDRWGEA